MLFCSGRQGTASVQPDEAGSDLKPLFDTILEYIPAPDVDEEAPFQMLVSSIDYSEFVGRIAIGRIERLAELFKVFGDSTRIRILFVLFEKDVCVCDLAETLNMTQSAISHQLKILKQNKLVKGRREGKSVFYSLADDHVRTIIEQGIDHIAE